MLIATAMPMAEPGNSALLRLMTWLSPAFPVGAFSYSHGLEWVVQDGAVGNGDSLSDWLTDLLRHGAGWSDAVLLAEAWRAVAADDAARLAAAAELGAALAPSQERHLETMQLGTAFLTAAETWPCAGLETLQGRAPYPVAVGAVAAGHDIALDAALPAYLNAFMASLVSAAVRLVPLGQSDGLRVLAALEPLVLGTAARAMAASLDEIGTAVLLSDIAAMKHETQYTRLFRS